MSAIASLIINYQGGKETSYAPYSPISLEETIVLAGATPLTAKIYYIHVGQAEFIELSDVVLQAQLSAFWAAEAAKENANPHATKLDGDHYLKEWRKAAHPKQK